MAVQYEYQAFECWEEIRLVKFRVKSGKGLSCSLATYHHTAYFSLSYC